MAGPERIARHHPARFNEANPPTGNFGWNAIARVRPGISPDRAATDLAPLVERAMREYIQSPNYRAFLTDGRYRPIVHAMKEDVVGSVREPLWILLGTVAMVLLVACGNVANLCLVRAEARQREIAVRIALGGNRRALVRTLAAEALVLSAIGSVVGVLVSAASLPGLLRLAPDTVPRLDQVRIDGWVLLVATAAAVVSALLFGLGPAIRTRPDVLACLRHGGRSATDHPGRHRGRNLLVVAQTAMALILLVGSGLLLAQLRAPDVGRAGVRGPRRADVPGCASADHLSEVAGVVRFTQQLVDRLAALPAVEAAGATTELPLAQGPAPRSRSRDIRSRRNGCHRSFSIGPSPRYFKALQIALLRGIGFDSGDLRDGVTTIVVNKTAAAQFWPGQDAIGKDFSVGSAARPASLVHGQGRRGGCPAGGLGSGRRPWSISDQSGRRSRAARVDLCGQGSACARTGRRGATGVWD